MGWIESKKCRLSYCCLVVVITTVITLSLLQPEPEMEKYSKTSYHIKSVSKLCYFEDLNLVLKVIVIVVVICLTVRMPL